MDSRAVIDQSDITLSVVVPVYNSHGTLPELVVRLRKVLEGLGNKYELIFVNDGSQDNSWNVIKSLCRAYDWITGINLMCNYGQHNALLCGIRKSNNSVVVTMDDDLQNPPEEIPKLLEKLKDGYDVVYGTPRKEQHGIWRDISSRISKKAFQIAMRVKIAGKVSAFRVFRTRLREGFASYQSSFVSIDVLLTWSTTRFSSVVVEHDQRLQGQSNYSLNKLVRHAFNMMTGFSTIPLQMASILGFILTLFGVIILVYTLGRWLLEGTVIPGFTFLASIITVFSGAQLFTLGVFGEYLARIHFRIMDRPPYVVREELRSG